MSWRDPTFKYFNAEASRKPGYLARRLKHYERVEREKQEARAANAAEAKQKVSHISKKVSP